MADASAASGLMIVAAVTTVSISPSSAGPIQSGESVGNGRVCFIAKRRMGVGSDRITHVGYTRTCTCPLISYFRPLRLELASRQSDAKFHDQYGQSTKQGKRTEKDRAQHDGPADNDLLGESSGKGGRTATV